MDSLMPPSERDQYQHVPLGETHLPLRAAFRCGEEALDRYLHERARKEMEQRLAAVWLLHDLDENQIAGYYTLSAAAIERMYLPPKLTRRMPKYEVYPATLLGRLAVDREYRGRGLGRRLLLDTLARALAGSRGVASVAVIVDAKNNEARSFYQRYGFALLETEGNEQRLFLPMSTVERLFAEARVPHIGPSDH